MKYKLRLATSLAVALSFLVACGSDSDDKDPPKEPDFETQLNGKFVGEILPPFSSPCFAGAYYRKAMSSSDYWLGMEGTVILPTIHLDSSRVNPAKPGQYLDNPSIYIGGTSDGQETDIGMIWEVIRDGSGNVSADRRSFRPFMRRSGHSASGQTALYTNAPAQSEYYWYQGDTITMSLRVIENGKLKFKVSGAGKSYENTFDIAGGKLDIPAIYKRVNAIDQVGNEGKPAQASKAKVAGSKWLSTYLLREYDGKVVKAPMHTGRYTDMRCPNTKYFEVWGQDKSAETITIDAGKQ